ncbi:hypothetical protein, partial [Neglectibacter timonensis]|uniref:hypothetical protein n=2 Tax=Neglectibacter timonensis TaxID=1776382 RepID=UPI003995ED2D
MPEVNPDKRNAFEWQNRPGHKKTKACRKKKKRYIHEGRYRFFLKIRRRGVSGELSTSSSRFPQESVPPLPSRGRHKALRAGGTRPAPFSTAISGDACLWHASITDRSDS